MQASDMPSTPGVRAAWFRLPMAALLAFGTLLATAAHGALPTRTDLGAATCLDIRPEAGLPVGPCTESLIQGEGTIDPVVRKHRELILEALATNDLDEALAQVEQLRALTPFDPVAPLIAAIILQDQGRHAEALDAFGQALAIGVPAELVRAQRSLSLAATKAFDKALADIDAAIASSPDEIGYKVYKGWILLEQGRTDEGLAHYDEAVRAMPESAWVLLSRAEALWKLGRLDKAIADAAEAITREPSNHAGYVMHAYLLMTKGEYEAARIDLDKAILLAPQDARPLVARSYAREIMGDLEGRDQDMAALKEKFPRTYYMLEKEIERFAARRKERGEKYDEAQEALQTGDGKTTLALVDELLKDAPDDRSPLVLMRARAAYLMGRHDEAAAGFTEVMELVGITYDMLDRRALALWKAGRLDEALADANAAIDRSSGSNPDYIETRAHILIDARRYDAALKDIQTLIDRHRSLRWAEGARIVVLYRQKRLANAGTYTLQHLRDWTSPDPAVAAIMYPLVIDLQHGSAWALADELLAIHAPRNPQDEFLIYLQARSAIRAGRIPEGIAHIERISSAAALVDIMADAVLRPVWDEPALAPFFDQERSRRRAFDRAVTEQHAAPGDLAAAIRVVASEEALGCPAIALEQAKALRSALDRYPGQAAIRLYGVMANVSRELGDLRVARDVYEDGLASVDDGKDGEVRLDLAMFLVSIGDPQSALEALGQLPSLSSSGSVTADAIRAYANNQLSDTAARDRALERLLANAHENPVQAVFAVGLLRSQDEGVELAVRLMGDPKAALLLLGSLHARPGAASPTKFDDRKEELLDRVRADPRIGQAANGVGRMLTLPAPQSCPLTQTEQEAGRIVLPEPVEPSILFGP